MIIALSQFNSTIGNLDGNTDLIQNIIRKDRDKADILVFPEMALTGYPTKDLVFDKDFMQSANNALLEISKNVFGIVVLLGTVRIENNKLYNTVAVMQSGKIIGFRDKTLLPTYDVFDEKRYFSSSKIIEPIEVKINNENIMLGLQVCEDLWDDNYDIKVTDILDEKKSNIIINLSASPFYVDRVNDRIDKVKQKVRKINKPYIYCNAVGYQDELVFDGQSFAVNSNGELSTIAPAFKEALLLFNISSVNNCKHPELNQYEQLYKALSLGVKDYLSKTHHSKAIIGLSGGIDSALTASIAASALNKNDIFGISMPSQYSSDHSIRDAELLACNLGINFEVIHINDVNDRFLSVLGNTLDESSPGLAEENLQARIRGNILMTIANKKNALLLNTGNKTEMALGYCTLYGDMCGALGVISDLNKKEVYGLSNWINNHYGKDIIPTSSLTKLPSAELSYNQVDPFDYNIVSPLVEDIIENGFNIDELVNAGYSYELCREIINKIRISEHKRYQSPPGIRVSKKAFGAGRRYPVINQYRS